MTDQRRLVRRASGPAALLDEPGATGTGGPMRQKTRVTPSEGGADPAHRDRPGCRRVAARERTSCGLAHGLLGHGRRGRRRDRAISLLSRPALGGAPATGRAARLVDGSVRRRRGRGPSGSPRPGPAEPRPPRASTWTHAPLPRAPPRQGPSAPASFPRATPLAIRTPRAISAATRGGTRTSLRGRTSDRGQAPSRPAPAGCR